MSRKNIAAGNWKMNTTVQEGETLYTQMLQTIKPSDGAEVIFCVPATHITAMSQLARPDYVSIGAQDISAQEKGAYTGEISGAMIAAAGAHYVIIGHSERRQYHNESNELLATKVVQALRHGLTPIFCCGEPLEIRKSGEHVSYVIEQLKQSFASFSTDELSKMVLAYEPIWAIGTGETATPEQAQEMHAQIRAYLRGAFGDEIADGMSILYGGSVKAKNAKEIFGQLDVDGGLVGGASLDAEQFPVIAASF